MLKVKQFFDGEYRRFSRYWWLGENRYSITPADHTPFNRALVEVAAGLGGGRALDAGAGEGADSIRLAKLGFAVDAIELSSVGADKIRSFAQDAEVTVNVICEDIRHWNPQGVYDLVLCNGMLQYVDDKLEVIRRLQQWTKPGGVNAISVMTNATPLPAAHTVVEVWPDNEQGVVASAYSDWSQIFLLVEHDKLEESHPGFPEHHHSFVKGIWQKSTTT